MNVCFERALHLRHFVGKPLQDAQTERTAINGQIDAIASLHRLDVSGRRHCRRVALLRDEERRWQVAFRSNPLRRILLELRVNRRAAAFVTDGAAK